MRNGPVDPGKPDARVLRKAMLGADDLKIKRILTIVDGVTDPLVNQTLLDPLRPRLATLKIGRPLRFSRLVLIPLDPLIVPARGWRPADPSVPRTALASIADTVRNGLGSEVSFFDKLITGAKVDTPMAVTMAGEMLWPRAAEILAVAPVPPKWAETGLPANIWPDLAKSVAAVLRRSPQLRRLIQDAEIGAVALDSDAVDAILRCDVSDPPVAYAMIVRLILAQAPHATPLLRQIIATRPDPAEQILLRQVIEREMDRVVSDLEDSAVFDEQIGRAGLAAATTEVRRMTTLLREVELDTNAVIRRSRLRAIREKLDTACQARFASGVTEGLVAPLTTFAEAVDGADQIGLESAARDLRRMEIVARKVGNPASYEQQMRRASQAVREAAEAGTLTPVRQLRLIEILAGPEAAEAMYDAMHQTKSAPGR